MDYTYIYMCLYFVQIKEKHFKVSSFKKLWQFEVKVIPQWEYAGVQ